MWCSVLQCVEVWCRPTSEMSLFNILTAEDLCSVRVLQSVAACCSVLQRVVMCCSVCCSVLTNEKICQSIEDGGGRLDRQVRRGVSEGGELRKGSNMVTSDQALAMLLQAETSNSKTSSNLQPPTKTRITARRATLGSDLRRGSKMVTANVTCNVCLSVCLSVCRSVCLSICLSVCLSVYLSVCLSVYLFLCLSVCLSVCQSVSLSVDLPW